MRSRQIPRDTSQGFKTAVDGFGRSVEKVSVGVK